MSPHDTNDDALREQGLQLVTRLVALLRTGRSYSIGNQVFTGQLEQLLEVLRPTLMEHGRARIEQLDGDLYLNGVRFQEQLQSEFALRAIGGLEFTPELRLASLEEFMRYFLPSELYKGAELLAACAAAGTTGACVVLEPAATSSATAGTGEARPAFAGALEAYDEALAAVRALLSPARFARGIELRHVKRALQPLIEASATAESAIVGLAWASAEDELWAHGVHVALVAIGMGRRLGLDRAALSDVAVAAVLHDIGHSLVDEPAGSVLHTVEGVGAVARHTTLNRTSLRVMRAALEHHRVADANPEVRPAPASRVVALADAYVSLVTAHAAPGRARTPSEALACLLGAEGECFDPVLRAALVRTLGVYPPGQIVELDDHSLARALAPLRDDPESAIVEQLTTPEGVFLAPSERVVVPLEAPRRVARALPAQEWPEFPADSAAA